MDQPVVTIGGIRVTLRPPTSFAVRYEISVSAAENGIRALAAALGVCWAVDAKRDRMKVRYESSYSPLVYGASVFDELVARGVRPVEIAAAGTIAYGLISEGVFSEDEVAHAEDFTEPPPGASTTP